MKFRRALALSLAAALLSGPFVLRAEAQDAKAPAAAAKTAPKTKRKKKAGKGRKKPAAESQYKSRGLSESGGGRYFFDADGNPVGAGAKKTSAQVKKKPAGDKPACGADAPCSDKKSSDADAL